MPIEFSHNVEGIDIRAQPEMKDARPVENADEGSEPQQGKWPAVRRRTPAAERAVYPGAGSELFHYLKSRK